MKFCTTCKARLDIRTPPGSDKIIFECFGCKKIYSSTPSDTLMYSRKYDQREDKSQYRFLANIAYMDDNLKIKKRCKKCSEEYVKLAITGNNMTRHFACVCGYIWSEG